MEHIPHIFWAYKFVEMSTCPPGIVCWKSTCARKKVFCPTNVAMQYEWPDIFIDTARHDCLVQSLFHPAIKHACRGQPGMTSCIPSCHLSLFHSAIKHECRGQPGMTSCIPSCHLSLFHPAIKHECCGQPSMTSCIPSCHLSLLHPAIKHACRGQPSMTLCIPSCHCSLHRFTEIYICC